MLGVGLGLEGGGQGEVSELENVDLDGKGAHWILNCPPSFPQTYASVSAHREKIYR